MSWFTFLESSEEATPASLQTPLRRQINLNDLENPFEAGDIIAIKLNGKKINIKLDSSLVEVEEQNSYLVVYEDFSDDTYFKPVKSAIQDDVLYFQAYENAIPDSTSTKRYSIYYGLNNINRLSDLGDGVFKQIDESESALESEYYLLDQEQIDESLFSATESSSKSFQLALYDNGSSWIDNVSQKIGARAFGVFDGPKLEIVGDKKSNFGKFRIRVNKMDEDNNFTKLVSLDWQVVDCFSRNNIMNEVLFSYSNFEYERYFFEIEILSEKNESSKGNSVSIKSYNFIPNYKIIIENEEINTSIPFIRIGGIK